MSENLCPRCGSEMSYFNRGGELVFDCHYDKKDCRIAALEKELEEANARAEDMKQRNAKLRQERVDYYNGSALEKVTAKYNGLLVSYDTLAQKPGRELILESQIHKVESERDAALAKVVGLEVKLKETIFEAMGQCSVLREALEASQTWLYHHPQQEGQENRRKLNEAVLNHTSATAQRVRGEIEREALEKAWERCEAVEIAPMQSMGHEKYRAAILGEKEKG